MSVFRSLWSDPTFLQQHVYKMAPAQGAQAPMSTTGIPDTVPAPTMPSPQMPQTPALPAYPNVEVQTPSTSYPISVPKTLPQGQPLPQQAPQLPVEQPAYPQPQGEPTVTPQPDFGPNTMR